ncbi:phage major capsid protein [Vallitalea pronyensis]|uniref:Phage major capsid protein n=1 Tax=Vallitalea pronyensis TaxID=1348613 RepID=A0A8J8MNR9_9FIRM|nr:phage major capsid protein [Vallitalea pronyensis]QUI24879.1 phage major capsid protein [Vallitalea pronyensis]
MNKKEYLQKRNALLTEAENLLNEGDVEKFNEKKAEIEALDNQFDKIAKAQANMNALKDGAKAAMKPEGNLDNQVPDYEDVYNSKEYRVAFMNYCKTGIMDDKFQNADTYTSTTDAGALVPTTIMEEIIKKMESYGHIFNRVRKSNIKGGVEVPILTLKPAANWIGESSTSDRQKVEANTKVSFSYHGLECKVAISLLADITTLSIFETTITQLIVEAMIKALDIAIIKGTGTGQPKGITVDTRIPAGNIITLSAADFVTWEGWKKKVFAKIPLAYRAGGSFIMAAGTFEGYIDGMVDANGQPIGRINYGISNGPQERFGGREVVLVEDDVITPYESAATNDIVTVFCKLSDYDINSNMQMTMYRWLDHDTNQWVDKAILIADGKILDPNGVIIVKKGV